MSKKLAVLDNQNVAVTVHENGTVTVKEGRGLPRLCRDCRFAGWLTEAERQENNFPATCLFNSGGADTTDGDRVVFDNIDLPSYRGYDWNQKIRALNAKWRDKFPWTSTKNRHGDCTDYVRAKPLPWWNLLRWIGRSYRTRKMRL